MMDVTKDPVYDSMGERSYALDDWRARLMLAILQNAIDELLGYRSPYHLVKDAERFIYDDNKVFDICMDILGCDKNTFRDQIAMMKVTGQRLRKLSDGGFTNGKK